MKRFAGEMFCRRNMECPLEKVRMQKSCKWKACETFPVLERKGGTDVRRWIVDSTLFE